MAEFTVPLSLAHPAVVLPLRRFCPRWLNFPALLVGSLSPDFGYLFGSLNVEDFSHGWVGSLAFCVPVSLLVLWLLSCLRGPLLGTLPSRSGPAFAWFRGRSLGTIVPLVLSIIIGVATHLAWDAFTHKNGWVVQHVTALQTVLFVVAGHPVRLYHVMWYGSSFGGVACLYLACESWSEAAAARPVPQTGPRKLRNALIAATLVLPIGAIHHLIHRSWAVYLAAALSLIIVASAVLLIPLRRLPSAR